MTAATISVVIPCYNSAAFLARAVDSLLAQTLSPTEVILVDNGSTDGTWLLIEQYRSQYPTLVHTAREARRGAPHARNTGLEMATCEWVQFLDSDDELLPEKLATQIAAAKAAEADLVAGSCFIYQWDGNTYTKRVSAVHETNPWMGLITSRLGRTTSNLYRRTALQAVNGWRTDLRSSQEYDLMFRLMQAGFKLACVAAPQAIIHVQENSIHKSKDVARSLEVTDTYLALRLRIREHLKNSGRLTPTLEQQLNTYLYHCIHNHRHEAPEYVQRKTKELGLKLTAAQHLRRRISMLKQLLRQLMGGNKRMPLTKATT